MLTYTRLAKAFRAALSRNELRQIAERLAEGAAELEVEAEEEGRGWRYRLAEQRSELLGHLAMAIEEEMASPRARA